MDTVIRALVIYIFLLVLFRITGKRTLSQITTFDFVPLLVISEATQQGLLGNDFSILNACLVILTLVGADLGLGLLSARWPALDRWANSLPLVLIDGGRMLDERVKKARADEQDILEKARQQVLERMDQIKYAVLERDGGISIIPKRETGA